MLNYNVFKNILCPLRHYFNTNLQLQDRANISQSALLGIIIHTIYAEACEKKYTNFYFCDKYYIDKKIKKYTKSHNKVAYIHKVLSNHLHENYLRMISKYSYHIEQILKLNIKDINIIGNITGYLKPDAYCLYENTAEIIEIKTGDLEKIDPIQLQLYAWILCKLHPELEHIILSIFNTQKNKLIIISKINKRECLEYIQKCIDSINTIYKKLNIKTVSEINTKITQLIVDKSIELADIDEYIPSILCKNCMYKVVCPSHLKEFINTFTNRFTNNTKSDKIVFANRAEYEASNRTLLVSQQLKYIDFLNDMINK